MVLTWTLRCVKKCFFEQEREDSTNKTRWIDWLVVVASDLDLAFDWAYFADTWPRDEVPLWIKILQLVFCVIGMFTWFLFAAEAGDAYIRVWNFLTGPIRIFIVGVLIVSVLACMLFGIIICNVIVCRLPDDMGATTSASVINAAARQIFLGHFLGHMFFFAGGGRTGRTEYSRGELLLFGAFVEDIPQVALSLGIDFGYKGDAFTSLAVFNILTAVYDLIIKLADGLDQLKDKQKVSSEDLVQILDPELGSMVTTATSAGDRCIVTGFSNGTFEIWNKNSENRWERQHAVTCPDTITSLATATSPNGDLRLILAGLYDGPSAYGYPVI